MRWMGMNEQNSCLRIEVFVLCDGASESKVHARWCVYNYAVIKLIYDEETRDRVAGNFYHLDGYFEKRWIIKDNWKCIFIRQAFTLDEQISKHLN